MTLESLLTGYGSSLVPAMDHYRIADPLEKAHFLAQVAHESGGFNHLTENLNYSAEGLHRTWPGRFPTIQAALPLANHPEAIANSVYADRLGNGATSTGDGWRFKGRGFIQTTGRANYTAASVVLFGDKRLLDTPELLEHPTDAANAACIYWNTRHLVIPARHDDLEGVTRGVNGGLVGLEQRRAWLVKFKQALGVSP